MRTLEVCCGSLDSAWAAVEGGATRIELCAALQLDGITPSIGLLRLLRERFPKLLIHVLIRPREGNFVYHEMEVCAMERDIEEAVDSGASAIVCGALTEQGLIDERTTARLIRAARGLPFTFHRAFDLVANKQQALLQLKELGVHRVLTSGGAPTAEAGIPVLRQLVQLGAKEISILPGGGVNRHNVLRILEATGATEIHGSCSITLPSGLQQTSAEEVREIVKLIR
ncbi:MAG: copper homeostasis protein CutC [Bacteroidaceae bacterium]|nr:copper homeostasis protein CutC [Bacteroidaceae bacterium]